MSKIDTFFDILCYSIHEAYCLFEREMRPLRSIQDNYEKIVLTLDRFSLGNYDGIKVVDVIDWLLG